MRLDKIRFEFQRGTVTVDYVADQLLIKQLLYIRYNVFLCNNIRAQSLMIKYFEEKHMSRSKIRTISVIIMENCKTIFITTSYTCTTSFYYICYLMLLYKRCNTCNFKEIDLGFLLALTGTCTLTFDSNKSASRRSSKLLASNFSCLLELVTATTRSNYTKQHTVH